MDPTEIVNLMNNSLIQLISNGNQNRICQTIISFSEQTNQFNHQVIQKARSSKFLSSQDEQSDHRILPKTRRNLTAEFMPDLSVRFDRLPVRFQHYGPISGSATRIPSADRCRSQLKESDGIPESELDGPFCWFWTDLSY
jgi:hypothetical protein